MIKMKYKIFFSLLPFFFCNLLSACSDKENEIPTFLTIDQKTVNFNADIASRDIPVKTSIDTWEISVQGEAGSWLEAGRNGSLLRISVTANKEMDMRQGEIKVIAGSLSETIIVKQLGLAPAILVSSDVYTMPQEGGDVVLEITSNVEYDIIIPIDAAWFKTKPQPDTRATEMVKKEYIYFVEWNSQDSERKTEISIKQKNGSLEKKITVIQKSDGTYEGKGADDIKNDIKIPVRRGTATSFQNGEGIEKSFDGSMSTIYHSAWNNNDANYFPITLDYFFENQESIDYFVYYPRTDGMNGRFKETEIWVSTEAEPTYKKLLDYDFKGSSSATKVIFDKPLVKPISVRFVVKSGAGDRQGFASCAEMEFYRINSDNFNPLTLFTDISCSQLKSGMVLSDIEKVSNNLYRNIALYMLNNRYPHEFRIQDYKAWPHPDAWASENKTSTLSLLDNPTGISVAEGEDLVVFVGATNGYALSLKVQNLNTPNGDGYENASYYPLSPGVNKLKIRNKGLVYVFYHTPDYRSAPPVRIHFATGKVNGYFDSQKHNAADWNKYLNAATDEYFDVLGEHAHLTFPTQHFRHYTGSNGPQLIAAYDDLVRLEKEFMGLMKYNRPTVNRAYFHAMYHSYMYATSYRTAYNVSGNDVSEVMMDVNKFKSSSWGPAHEQGHTFQTRPGFKWHGMTEVTNNVHSLYVETEWGNVSRIESENMGRYNNRYEKAYYNSFVKETPHPGEEDVFCKLVSLWQLQLYFSNARSQADTYKDLYERVRTSPNKPNAGEQQLEFVKMMCDITRTDLTPFFRKWGYLTPFDQEIDDYGKARVTITQSQADKTIADIATKNHPLLTEKMEYICDSNWEIFKHRLAVQQGSATKNGTKITMTNWENVVAYEVYEGDSLVFVSNKASFNLDSPVTVYTRVFAVAYDGNKTEVKFE